uniref:PH01B001I13.18 protein n=1 Tax=Phyllostachys edulis TaxID=38705 RepID=L0P2E5_PHYED|nr:PH01B001I13.18 [Phyllostachys edulis]
MTVHELATLNTHEAVRWQTNTPLAEFVFFGDVGQELVGIPALDLAASAPTVTGFIPPEITRLYGHQYDLKVSGSRGLLQRISASFQVDSFNVIPTKTSAPFLLAICVDASKDSNPTC